MNEDKKYASLLDFLKENEEKLKVFLSADEKMKGYRYNLKGKKHQGQFSYHKVFSS